MNYLKIILALVIIGIILLLVGCSTNLDEDYRVTKWQNGYGNTQYRIEHYELKGGIFKQWCEVWTFENEGFISFPYRYKDKKDADSVMSVLIQTELKSIRQKESNEYERVEDK